MLSLLISLSSVFSYELRSCTVSDSRWLARRRENVLQLCSMHMNGFWSGKLCGDELKLLMRLVFDMLAEGDVRPFLNGFGLSSVSAIEPKPAHIAPRPSESFSAFFTGLSSHIDIDDSQSSLCFSFCFKYVSRQTRPSAVRMSMCLLRKSQYSFHSTLKSFASCRPIVSMPIQNICK